MPEVQNIHNFETQKPLTLWLLKLYGAEPASPEQVQLSDQDVEALYRLGLFFLVLNALETGAVRVSDEMRDLVYSADLTARVIYGQLCATLEHVLTIAEQQSIPVLLLKGIANAEDLYLQPHHRIMGDIDLLVPARQAEPLYRQLLDSGYQPTDPDRGMIWATGHHHLQPLKHPKSDIPVEIHTALFSRAGPDLCRIFKPDLLWLSAEEHLFRDRSSFRLTRELDLLYTIAHWAADRRRTTNAIGICDVGRMFQVRGSTINWQQTSQQLCEVSLLSDNFAVIFLLLERARIASIPDPVQDNVAAALKRIGKMNLRVLHFLVNTYSLTGRKKFAGFMTREHAQIVWDTILAPGNRTRRLPTAASRILNLRRKPDESLLSSLLKRVMKALDSDN